MGPPPLLSLLPWTPSSAQKKSWSLQIPIRGRTFVCVLVILTSLFRGLSPTPESVFAYGLRPSSRCPSTLDLSSGSRPHCHPGPLSLRPWILQPEGHSERVSPSCKCHCKCPFHPGAPGEDPVLPLPCLRTQSTTHSRWAQFLALGRYSIPLKND